MAVSKRLRFEILRRDNHACRYCGAAAPDVKLVVDHVTPIALGGTDAKENLVTACVPCNSGKTSSAPGAHLIATVSDDQLRWSMAMKQAAETAAAKREGMDAYRTVFHKAWHAWTYGSEKNYFDLPNDWAITMDRFHSAGLPAVMWDEIVSKTMTAKLVGDPFKYTCGIAWSKVAELQESARQILSASTAMTAPPVEPTAAAGEAVAAAAEAAWIAARLHYDEDDNGHDLPAMDPYAIEAIRTDALNLHASKISIEEILRGTVWTAGCYIEDAVDIDIADANLEREKYEEYNKQRVAFDIWQISWCAACAARPSDDAADEFWTRCQALYALGAFWEDVALAGAVAGSRCSTQPWYGLRLDLTRSAGIDSLRAFSEDAWATSWRLSEPDFTWPSDAEREAFRMDFDTATESGAPISPMAAARAGIYRDTTMRWTSGLSIIASAHTVFDLAAEEANV